MYTCLNKKQAISLLLNLVENFNLKLIFVPRRK